jgi:hypothetical protein
MSILMMNVYYCLFESLSLLTGLNVEVNTTTLEKPDFLMKSVNSFPNNLSLPPYTPDLIIRAVTFFAWL